MNGTAFVPCEWRWVKDCKQTNVMVSVQMEWNGKCGLKRRRRRRDAKKDIFQSTIILYKFALHLVSLVCCQNDDNQSIVWMRYFDQRRGWWREKEREWERTLCKDAGANKCSPFVPFLFNSWSVEISKYCFILFIDSLAWSPYLADVFRMICHLEHCMPFCVGEM